VHPELVRVHAPLHDELTQPISRGEHHHATEPTLRVEREADAGRGLVAADHALHADRQRDVPVIDPLVRAVDDGAIGEERGHAGEDRALEVRPAAHAEEAVLLACEGRAREVLSRGARAHGDVDRGLAGLPGQLFVGGARLQGHIVRQRRPGDALADPARRAREGGHVLHVEPVERCAQVVRHAARSQVPVPGGRRQREAVRYPHARLGQAADHLAQGGVLAADQGQVVEGDLGQGEHVGHGPEIVGRPGPGAHGP